MFLADSHLQSFQALYSNCCEFVVKTSMLHEAKHATAAYNREHENKLSVSQQVVFCLLMYTGIITTNILCSSINKYLILIISGILELC